MGVMMITSGPLPLDPCSSRRKSKPLMPGRFHVQEHQVGGLLFYEARAASAEPASEML